jgi:carbamate kinase
VLYSREKAEQLAQENHWIVKADGNGFRRVVASPKPIKILGLESILWLLEHHAIVIAAGGGGIPVVPCVNGHGYQGASAIIDKDLCSALLAEKISAQRLLIVTDVSAVFLDWGTPNQRAIRCISPEELSLLDFSAGSMGPKVAAACEFVLSTGNSAVIGSLENIISLMDGQSGTWVKADCAVTEYEN